MIGTEKGSLEYKQVSSWSLLQLHLRFAWFFIFFNDHFLLFILARVATNHKSATESDLLNNIAGVLNYAHDKIGAGCSHYGSTIQFYSNFAHKYTTLISKIGFP